MRTGQPARWKILLETLPTSRLGLIAQAADDVIFMHCSPAHRGEEVTDEVIDGSRSRVFEQAANRLPTEQAILWALIAGALSHPDER